MDRLLLMTLIAGCAPEPSTSPRIASQETPMILCAYALDEPPLSGALPNHLNDGVDCVPPEGGDLFTLGFGWRGGLIQVAASRPASEWRIYARTQNGWCVDWEGEVTIEDLPDWSVTLNVRCADGSLQLAGRIDSGR
jgi:hypothetical protein